VVLFRAQVPHVVVRRRLFTPSHLGVNRGASLIQVKHARENRVPVGRCVEGVEGSGDCNVLYD